MPPALPDTSAWLRLTACLGFDQPAHPPARGDLVGRLQDRAQVGAEVSQGGDVTVDLVEPSLRERLDGSAGRVALSSQIEHLPDLGKR